MTSNWRGANNPQASMPETPAARKVFGNDAAVYVAGHRGMVGSAIVRCLEKRGYANLVTRERGQLDLCEQSQVREFFAATPVDCVVLAAARVGGIHANDAYPAEFIYRNLMIEVNVIHEAWRAGVRRLLFLGSSCIYPRLAVQPMRESQLLQGALEPTNEPYAVAKIAGIKLCESYNRQYATDYRSLMPTNLYGPGDNFHPEHSHVIPGLIRRFLDAKEAGAPRLAVWGTGRAKRDFLHVDDLADACVHAIELSGEAYAARTSPMQSHVNVGSGREVTIAECASLVRDAVGYRGEIAFDADRPDGTPRKLLDTSIMDQLGWRAGIGLAEGIADTCAWFLKHRATART